MKIGAGIKGSGSGTRLKHGLIGLIAGQWPGTRESAPSFIQQPYTNLVLGHRHVVCLTSETVILTIISTHEK